jgi:hypothetical protein
MIVKPLRPEDFNLDIAPEDPKRSPGLHMSDIYGRLYERLEPKRYGHDPDEDPARRKALFALGFAVEQYTERLLLAAGIDAHRPPEFRTPDEHGIAFSPDLLIYNGNVRGGEIKATFMSTGELPTATSCTFPPKMDKYLTQMKSYGHNLEIPDWVLFGWFLKGDYTKAKGGGEPFLVEFRPFQFTFTAREMRDEYVLLIRFARTEKML